jgi:hypothetical protein
VETPEGQVPDNEAHLPLILPADAQVGFDGKTLSGRLEYLLRWRFRLV